MDLKGKMKFIALILLLLLKKIKLLDLQIQFLILLHYKTRGWFFPTRGEWCSQGKLDFEIILILVFNCNIKISHSHLL